MSKRMFTQDQIKALLANKNVVKCSKKSITYCPDFKLMAVKQYYHEGISPMQIFMNVGFDITVIGAKTPKECLRRWTKVFKKKGMARLLKDNRGRDKGGGRPKTKNLSDKEKIERLEAKVAYLKAENDFLAKLRAARKE